MKAAGGLLFLAATLAVALTTWAACTLAQGALALLFILEKAIITA